MNILVVSQYFWPENFRINDLVGELVRRGHMVTVLTGHPNYPDGEIFPEFRKNPRRFAAYEGAVVVRVPVLPRHRGGLRLALNYLSFALAASFLGPWKLRGRSFDAIFVFEPSPVTVGLPALVLKAIKRAPVALWVLDLWPQSLAAVGAVRSKPALWAVDQLARLIYAGCDRVLAQSKSFVPQLAQQVRDQGKLVYFPSWAEPLPSIESAAAAPEIEERSDLFTIVFTGNIGEAQDFPAVVEAAELLRDEPVRWVVVGDGRKAEWVRAEAEARLPKGTFVMPGRFPLERMPSFLRHADALLVSLRREPIFALTIPGKLQTYLKAGLPVLAILDGEGAEVVRSAGAGLVAPAGDAHALAGEVRRMRAMSAEERREMGRRGRELYARDFDRDTLIGRLEEILGDMRCQGR